MLRVLRLISFLLLLVGARCALSAQEARFFWGPELYPNYTAPRLLTYGNLSLPEREALQEQEIGRPAYALGLNAGWSGEKLGFRFGLRFAESGYRTRREPFPNDLPNPEGITESRALYTQYRIDIPLSLDFSHQLDNRNRFFFSMGMAAGLQLAQRESNVLYFGDIQEKRPGESPDYAYRRLNWAFHTSMGWETYFSDNLSLSLAPTFQFWLSPLLQGAPIDRSLYSVGLLLGLRFYRG